MYDHSNLINQYTNELNRIIGEYKHYVDRYLEAKNDPVKMVHLLIKGLVEDCTFVMDVKELPDSSTYNKLLEESKKDQPN